MKVIYNKDNLDFARQNRRLRNMTKEERLLWYTFLRNANVQFYRQYRVGNYILDFYCPTKKLAVEIDGGQHYEDSIIVYDKQRTLYLSNLGIKVLRYGNNEIEKSLKNVCEDILQNLN